MRHPSLRALAHLAGAIALVAAGVGCSAAPTMREVHPDSAGNYGPPVDSGAVPAADVTEFGATQGGLQDLSFARELVASGRVPPPEAFVAEGMFSAHELGLSGTACTELLCLRAASGVAPRIDRSAAAWIEVGLASSLDPTTFVRPSLTLVAAVDVSGSMGWSYQSPNTEYPTPGAVARKLLSDIAQKLGAADRLAIVTYDDSVTRALPLVSGAEQTRIEAAIDALTSGGSTAMEAGLEEAFAVAREAQDGATDEVRVMLFTDVQPNVGATTPSAFQTLASAAADDGIGLTVFGLGVGLGQTLLREMVSLRGGNAFTLADYDDEAMLMQDSWPFFASPIAYDLSVSLTAPVGLQLGATYGFPAPTDATTSLDVATVFLSRRGGALLVELVPDGEVVAPYAATLDLTYAKPDGTPMNETLTAGYGGEALDAAGRSFEQPSVGKSVALALLVEAMQKATTLYATSHVSAASVMRAARDRFASDVSALGATDLTVETSFASSLLALMEGDAPQGDLYGL